MTNDRGSMLHIIDTTGPGGAETIFTQLAAYTQNAGFRSIAIIRGPGWVEQELSRLGIETRVIDCKGSFNLKFLRTLISIIRTERVELIQSHLLGSAVYAGIAGLLTHTPVCSTFHGLVDVSPRERLRWAKFLIIQLATNRVIAVTEQLKDMLMAISTLSAQKVDVIPNGIDTEHYSPESNPSLRRELDLPESALLVGCLGNVRKAKNYDLAIETLAELRKGGKDARLLIAGDDKNDLAERHRQYAQELGVAEYIVWLGFWRDARGFLNGIDVFLLSSSSEGQPLAVTQAMATETPIVATLCGVEELVTHRKTALLASLGDAKQLAAYIGELSENPQLRTTLTKAAQKHVREKLSLKSMCDEYNAVYLHALEGQGERPGLLSRYFQLMASNYGGKKGYLRSAWHQLTGSLSGGYLRYGRIPPNTERVVFVCKGNVCRSAAAEHAFRKYCTLPTASIGLDTDTGLEANPRITQVARTMGLDMSTHLTTAKDDFVAKDTDLFVCMEPIHIAQVKKAYNTRNIVLLGTFGQPKRVYIHDPYSSTDAYAAFCTNYIYRAVKTLSEQLEKRTVLTRATD
ncbi:glycosyltransferase [Marinimicrobium sp. ABcell2]|uniref:glycosyltransferase n=1 Tax=Marinimicrobium sp. ABcell2 TaxID=3069751 RepID=UPI0027B27328|nr:glycosyltransferase [Marinimicrobium sp. ABcell2]MDQ2076166.1 glycosyltransferase [Marinimicrobium sp. ABcell2]